MNTKKLTAGCMAALILAGSVLSLPLQTRAGKAQQEAPADTKEGRTQPNALTDTHKMPLSDMQADFYQVEDLENSAGGLALKGTQAAYDLSASEWADSGCDYYFSLLNTSEKKLYLNLKTQADRYLTGTDNFQTTKVPRNGKSATAYILPMVSYEGLAAEQMKKVFYCFFFENPQYYFMRNAVIYSDNTKMMTIGLYEIFADGGRRAEYTSQFAQQIAEWEQQIAAAETAVEKEQLIHRLVCAQVDYDDTMPVDDPDDKSMSQSCISAVLFGRSAVCAGYAQLFSLLCSRAGIPCVTVTSAGHAWNKVRMGSIWYNVDCTWDDGRGDEMYLNVTDEMLMEHDTALLEHVMSFEWQGIAPSCTVKFDAEAANGADIGANVLTPGKMMGITVLSREKGRISVSFEPREGCDGYTVQYAANASMNPSKKKNIEKTSCAITGVTSGKTYYVRVRAYALDSNGNKLYGAYSNKLPAAVK